MKAEVGMKVLKYTGYGYLVWEISSRTANTIATQFLNGSPCDCRVTLYDFGLYDQATGERIIQLDQQIEEMRQEQRELYQSLERLG